MTRGHILNAALATAVVFLPTSSIAEWLGSFDGHGSPSETNLSLVDGSPGPAACPSAGSRAGMAGSTIGLHRTVPTSSWCTKRELL
jgi:hypothetical protein